MLKREDFTFTGNARGFTLFYRGKSIGGAGIQVTKRLLPRDWQTNVTMFRNMATRDIGSLVAGRGCQHYRDAIAKLD